MRFKSASFYEECLEDKNVIGNFACRNPDPISLSKRLLRLGKQVVLLYAQKFRFIPCVTPVVKSLAQPTTVVREEWVATPFIR